MLFKKRSKKGLSHVDWAMSLAIFLLYLAWFFIFVKPMLSPSQSMDTLLDILDDGVSDVVFQDVERVRIFIPDDMENGQEPVVIPFHYSWKVHDIAHSADHFVVDDGRMFFLADLYNSSMFEMYHPHDALVSSPLMPVVANEERVWEGDFKAYFDDYLLDSIYFMGEERLSALSVEVDDEELDDEGSFMNSTLLARYRRSGDSVNISSYAFSENSVIYSYITSADYGNHSVEVRFGAYNYSYYYVDPMSDGEFSYPLIPGCRYYETDFLDLYDSSSGLLVVFSDNISMGLCNNGTNPYVLLEFDLTAGEEEMFGIVLHEGDVYDVLEYPLEPVVGVTERLKTVSVEQVSLLRNRDYDYLKQLFHYPKARDFNVTVHSDAVDVSFGIPQPEVADIYARRIEGVIIDENYEPQRALITLTVW